MRPREYIKIRGASEHNLTNLDVDIPRNELVVLTGLSGSGSLPWLLTRFMRKASADIWSPFPLMLDNSLARWKSPTWRKSKVCPQQFPSIRSQPTETPFHGRYGDGNI